MKIRAIANGNILDIEDQQQTEALIQAGIFEAVAEEQPKQEEQSEQEEDAAAGAKARRAYKRRDMQAEG